MKVLVTGDRNWDSWREREDEQLDPDDVSAYQEKQREFIYRVLDRFLFHDSYMVDPQSFILVEGEARGADKIARNWGIDRGVIVSPYPADWKTYGRSAGILRNVQMIKENPDIDVVIAFHPDLTQSRGTKHMVEYAIEHSNAYIHLYNGTEEV